MTNQTDIQFKIATILRSIGSIKCLKKAEGLIHVASPMSNLHLRNLDLNSSDITSLVSSFQEGTEVNNYSIKSISFSYNNLLGDNGAIVLMKNLTKSITEVGLVSCGITDIGGREILNWMRNSPNLQMICMEQNSFSEKLRLEFKAFKADNPRILVIY